LAFGKIILRALDAAVFSGVAKVPSGLCSGAKNVFAPPSTKLQSLM